MTQDGQRLALVTIGIAVLALFISTAARTITWWEGAQYPLLATTLSIANPPGSLLLTLTGWLWTRVVWCPPVAFQLAVLAAAIAAGAVMLTAACAARLQANAARKMLPTALAALAAGGWLATAFHLWSYATQFTPYGLTALFTALLLATFLRWWERAGESDDVAGLAIVALVLGLDFSVHRTNQLLAPALVLGVALRRPAVFRRPLTLVPPVLAYAVGIATQALYFVLSARHPLIDMADLHSGSDLWHFMSLGPIGGGFLVNLWPRRADFLRVQVFDWLQFLWANLGAIPVTRWLALLLALFGVGAMLRRAPRLACALLALFLCAGLGAVLFFNRPESYFRPLERHYLPSLVMLAVFVGTGAQALAESKRPSLPALLRPWPVLLVTALIVWNVAGNHARCDRSHSRMAEIFARDLLEPLPRDAILFTNGDNDSFPLYYLQQAEHVRSDVLVLSIPLLYTPARQRALAAMAPAIAVDPMRPAASVVSASLGRRPVYVAVTVDLAWGAELERGLVIEGLSQRMQVPGATESETPALERFVAERVPRALEALTHEIAEPLVFQMLGNYVHASLSVAQRQWAAGRRAQALATLERVERDAATPAFGAWGVDYRRQLAEFRGRIESEVAPSGPRP